MQKDYEYKTVTYDYAPSPNDLVKLSENGWLVKSVTENGGKWDVIVKREKQK